MFSFPIALQIYSVRDEASRDFEGTLKIIKKMGYDGVEFAGLYHHSAKEVKEWCQKIGLIPISAHVSFNEMIENPDAVMNTYKEIGCSYIVIPSLLRELLPGCERAEEGLKLIKQMGEKALEYGLTLSYHNHDFEFQKTNDKYMMDVLYEKIPISLLHTQLDTCWVKVAGEDPAEYVRKYAGREDMVHLKDFVGSKSDRMYQLIGVNENEKPKQAEGKFELRPVGSGVQDFTEILQASEDAGVKWVVVEQDTPSMGKTPLECAQMSIRYLRKIYY